MIKLKRAYEPFSRSDGARLLVERLWPRGVSKEKLRVDAWLKEAGPSTPVNVTGLDVAPNAGEKFYVLGDIAQARELAAARQSTSRQESLAGITTRVSFDDFQQRLERLEAAQPQGRRKA